MIFDKLNTYAEGAITRYQALTDSWRALFINALNENDFGSVAQSQRMVQDATQVADAFLRQIMLVAESELSEISTDAHSATLMQIDSQRADDTPDAALEHLRVVHDYLRDEVIAQILRDIALLRQTLQRVVLEVSSAARSRGITQRTALIEYRIGNQTELEFLFRDRANRRLASGKYIRQLWRHTLLAVYNETVMITLSSHGITKAEVWHRDPIADVNGKKITFGSNSGLPTYSEIRDIVFHPNANSVLIMEGADVFV